MKLTHLVLLMIVCLPLSVTAEIKSQAHNGFHIQIEKVIAAPPENVYDKLVNQVGKWWHPDHTWAGKSSALSIEASPGGCFCEQLDDGGVKHMEVVYVRSGSELRMTGGLGPLQMTGAHGGMSWRLDAADDGSKLTLHYRVTGFLPGGMNQFAGPVDDVLQVQLNRLAAFAEGRSLAVANTPAK